MTTKRQIDQDPDYESIPAELQQKRLRLIEQDAREFTIKKIEKIIRMQFNKEIKMKEAELQLIDEKLHEARIILDRLRACIVMKYYSSNGEQVVQSSPSVHPTVKKCLGKSPKFHPQEKTINNYSPNSKISLSDLDSTAISQSVDTHNIKENDINHGVRLKRKLSIIVGNVSKYIPADSRDENDQATHKWMVYVRGSKDNPHIENVIKKVQFFLHPSYRPNDLVEVCDPPFHLTRRGWGEFPIRVQLHFHNQSNKPVDIIHNLKLDKTYTGLQTLGAETAVDLWLFRKEAKRKMSGINCRRSSSVSEGTPEKNTGTVNCDIVKNKEPPHNNLKASCVDTHKPLVETNGILSDVSKAQQLENNCSYPKSTVDTSSNQKNSKLPIEDVKKTKSVLLIIPPTINKTIISQEPLQQPPQLQNYLSKQLQESSPKKIIPVPLNSNFPKTSVEPTGVSQVTSVALNNKNNLSQKTAGNLTSATDLNLNASLNGLTTFVKCMDNQGRILLVPQSSVVKLPNSLKTKTGVGESLVQPNQNNQLQADQQSSNSKCISPKSQKNVSSYMVKVLPNHTGSMNQVILIPANQTSIDSDHLLKKSPSTSIHAVNISNLAPNKAAEKAISLDSSTVGKNNTKIPKRDDSLVLKKALLSIRLEYYETMFELINKVVKLFPLINKDIDRSCHPYCAPSVEVYYSWNVGKQRAAEWHRAKAVRQAILQLLNQKSSSFTSKDVWSTKEILVWCYRNGYTPKRQNESIPNPQHHFGVLSEVSTVTESSKLLEMLEKEKTVPEMVLFEEEIDILNTDNDHSCITSKNLNKENILLDRFSYTQSLLSIPDSSACVEFVREAASKIGLKFQPCELAPSIMGHVIEEMILASCKEFISDILRVALSESFNKIGKKLYPDTIGIEDIFSAIQKLPLCDIFTNKYLGVSPNDQQSENK
ncbi:YEATS domain-containing protein 2 [Centruroides vittatus]|uniref:YEATS domain-containing protein 2 n=1 Tax=Centruroides vittatus TaxID=120091 RepID=UPI003510075F